MFQFVGHSASHVSTDNGGIIPGHFYFAAALANLADRPSPQITTQLSQIIAGITDPHS